MWAYPLYFCTQNIYRGLINKYVKLLLWNSLKINVNLIWTNLSQQAIYAWNKICIEKKMQIFFE